MNGHFALEFGDLFEFYAVSLCVFSSGSKRRRSPKSERVGESAGRLRTRGQCHGMSTASVQLQIRVFRSWSLECKEGGGWGGWHDACFL